MRRFDSDGIHSCWTEEGLMMRHNFPRVLCKPERWANTEEDHYHAWAYDLEKHEYRRLTTAYATYIEGDAANAEDLVLPCRTPCPGSGVAPFYVVQIALDPKGVGMSGLPFGF